MIDVSLVSHTHKHLMHKVEDIKIIFILSSNEIIKMETVMTSMLVIQNHLRKNAANHSHAHFKVDYQLKTFQHFVNSDFHQLNSAFI